MPAFVASQRSLLSPPPRVFYVDATAGSDSNTGTSPRAAWQTIGKVNAASLRSGDRVLFKRGETWTASLSAQSGVLYADYGSGAKPIIDGTGVANPITATNKNSITLVNLNCKNGTTGTFFNTCTTIAVIDCDMSAGGNDCLAFQACSFVTVLRGTYNSAAAGGGHAGIEITDACTDVLIDGATCDGNPIGITIHNHNTPTQMPTRITVKNCTITNSSLNPFQISYDGTATQTTDITVDSVVCDTTSGGSPFSIQRISTGVLSGSIVLKNCIGHGAVNGAFYTYHINGIDDVTLIRCVSYHTGAATAERVMRINDAKRPKIYNCTLYRPANPGGIAMIWIDGARGDAIEVKNCIVANGGAGLIPIEVSAAFVGGGGSLSVDYNLYQSSAASSVWKYNGSALTFANWKTNSGQDAHSIAGSDPLFVDPTTAFDFHLQAGSPAMNAGVVIAGVTDGYLGAAPDLGYAEKA
jgi:hypothetical protein